MKRNKEKLLTGVLSPLRYESVTIVAVVLCYFVTVSCRDHFELDKLDNPSKMVVYCFPSTEDTTFISVTTSVGVKKMTDTHQIQNLFSFPFKEEAGTGRITYTVNGEVREIQLTDDGRIFVLGQQKPGDHISIRAEHPDYGVAEATATVPEAVPVKLQKVVAVMEYDPEYYEARDFHKLLATFTDPAATEDYYAVRVGVRKYKGWAVGHVVEGGQEISTWYVSNIDDYNRMQKQYPSIEWESSVTDSITLWPQVVTNDEPLLNPLSDIDSDFGFDNDYYDNFYIFSDNQINGQTYTLHLNISVYTDGVGYYWGQRFQVVLYHISPEFYHFLKSYNDMNNNELAQGGFAQVAPTLSNIRGGLGLLGSYAVSKSNWQTLDK